MKAIMKAVLFFSLLALCATQALGSDAPPPPDSSDRQGPPPEAYQACEGKSAGDQARFTTPRGDAVTGVCEQEGDRLVLRPDNQGQRGKDGGRRQGPPPEAYQACEGKSVGDQARFTTPRGDAVTGVCEQEGDRLVLRPDRPPREDAGGMKNNQNN